MFRQLNITPLVVISFLSWCLVSDSDCSAQCTNCGSVGLYGCCQASSNGCSLQAYGISAQIIAYTPGSPPTFYVRVASSGAGFVTGDEYSKVTASFEGSTTGYLGSVAGRTRCASAYGNCVFSCGTAQGTVLTLTPGVQNQLTQFSYISNIGQSIYLTLDTTQVQKVDTGMLGPSTCDVKPSTERGDPINISSGNVYRNEVDAVINSGKIGAFSFERNYNSLNQELSGFGYGWRYNFDIRVLGSTSSPSLQEGSGRKVPYYFCDSTSGFIFYCRPPGITDSLYFVKGSPGGYGLKKRNDASVGFTNLSDTPAPINRIKKITDRNSNEINFVYNGTSGLLDTIREPGGRAYNFVYSGTRITQLKNQAGTTLATYEYHTGADTNYLKKVTFGDNSWAEYTYNGGGTPKRLSKVLTSDNNEYFYAYDSFGKAFSSWRTEGIDSINISYMREISTGAIGDKLSATVRDALGNKVDSLITIPNALATERLLTKGFSRGCGTCADSFTYDMFSNLIRNASPLGVVDTSVFDTLVRNRLNVRTEARGTSLARTHAFRYGNFDLTTRDSTGSVVTPSDSLTRIFQYDAKGNNTTITESGLISTGVEYTDITSFTYGSYGQLNKIDGPRNDVADTTRFVYDSTTTGDLKEVREYSGSTALITQYTSYDAFGNPLTVIGPNGDETNYRYDARQRVDRIIRKKGSVADTTLYQYNFAGDIKLITLPRSNTIKYEYDLAGRLTNIVNGAGDSTIYTYDLMSNRKSERMRKADTLYKTTYYDYDSRSRLIQICVGDSSDASKFDCTGFGYDDAGNRIAQLSARGDSTYFRYDALNRPDRIIQKHDGGYDTTAYTYDLQDNLTSVRIYHAPDSTTTTYKYSDRGHLIEEASPASGTTTYTYDPAGNLTQKTTASGDVINYAYDALNRQTSISYGALSYTFDYDASATNNRKGRLWRETGPVATRKFSYDYVGRVARESVIVATKTYFMNYTYDKNGNLLALRYPDNRNVTYTYDLADRIFKVVSLKGSATRTAMDSVRYLPFGPDTSMKLGNGVRVSKTYDKRYYVQSITNSVAGKFGRSYQYDHNGNITQLLDLIDNTKSYNTITYDGLDRLTQAYGLNRTDSLFFTYQKNGNRLTKRKGNQILTNYNYVNNRLRNTTGAEVVNYGYNANGSNIGDTLGAGTLTYIYDKLNRMIKITGITPADTFAYDGENRRIYSKESGVQLVNLYDIFGNLIAQYPAGSGLYTTDYIWANGEPRMRIDTLTGFGLAPLAPGDPTESPYWYHTDHLGTPYVLTDTLKAVQWKISLDPFGETVSEETPVISDNLRFPGQIADRASLLNYNWHRYYQPKIGRYYQTDPYLGFHLSEKYNYAENNPIILIDPPGLDAWKGFWWHYFNGGGKAIDLADIGLLDKFRKTVSVQRLTSGFEASLQTAVAAKAKDLCSGCDPGEKSISFTARGKKAATDVTPVPGLTPIGSSSFFRAAHCDLTVDCSSYQYYYFCSLKYSIRDKFENPLLFRIRGKEIGYRGEIPGGTVYPINTTWTGFIGGIGGW